MKHFFLDLLSDRWLFAVALAQLLLAVLGAIVTVQEDWAKRHRGFVLSLFVVFALVGLVATSKQGAESARAQTELADSLGLLNRTTQNAVTLEIQNKLLQQEALALTRTNETLTQQGLNTATGADTFCYVSPVFQAPDKGEYLLTIKGKYPLHDLNIVEIPIGIQQRQKAFQYPIISTQFAKWIDTFDLTGTKQQDFLFLYYAVNGFWVQDLQFRKVGQSWVTANKVERGGIARENNGTLRSTQQLLIEEVASNYPRINGQVDWKTVWLDPSAQHR